MTSRVSVHVDRCQESVSPRYSVCSVLARRENRHSLQAISYERVLVCVVILVKRANLVKSKHVRMDAILDFAENCKLTETSVGITIFFSDMPHQSIFSPCEHSVDRTAFK